MNCWPFAYCKDSKSTLQEFDMETNMADHVAFAKRVRKSLYYGEYSDASLPSLSVTDVAVEVLNNYVPPNQRILDRQYAHSVARRAKISPCALMMGMLYAERLRQKHSQWSKNLSSSDIFLISIMVASKYLYDEGEDEEVYNDDWAKAGFKTTQDINKLERDFLRMMDWNLFISKEEFSNFVSQVESRVAITRGLSRGWLTYHDMFVVLGCPNILKILLQCQNQLLKTISSCLAAYILGVSILLGSSTLLHQSHTTKTTANPTYNCLTTEAECLFTHNLIDISYDEPRHHVIAGRKTRSNQRVLAPLWSSNKRKNTTGSSTRQQKMFPNVDSLRKEVNDVENMRLMKNFNDPSFTTFPDFTKLVLMTARGKFDNELMSGYILQKPKIFSCAFTATQISFNNSIPIVYSKQGFCNG